MDNLLTCSSNVCVVTVLKSEQNTVFDLNTISTLNWLFPKAFSRFTAQAFKVRSFSRIKKESYGQESRGLRRPRVTRFDKTLENSAGPRATGEGERAKLGARTSTATRKTIQRRERRESLSSRPSQGSLQGKDAGGHQKPRPIVIQEYSKSFSLIDAFGEGPLP